MLKSIFPNSYSSLAAQLLSLAAVLFLITGCVTYMPVDEYSIARAAYEAAKDADAARFAPALWFNAEQAYREAEKSFKDRRFGDAQSRFIVSRELSERAENAARLARHDSGEIIP